MDWGAFYRLRVQHPIRNNNHNNHPPVNRNHDLLSSIAISDLIERVQKRRSAQVLRRRVRPRIDAHDRRPRAGPRDRVSPCSGVLCIQSHRARVRGGQGRRQARVSQVPRVQRLCEPWSLKQTWPRGPIGPSRGPRKKQQQRRVIFLYCIISAKGPLVVSRVHECLSPVAALVAVYKGCTSDERSALRARVSYGVGNRGHM